MSDMLYEVTLYDYSDKAPDSSATSEMSGDMACSGVRNGGFVGCNFDYYMNQYPTFVIRTNARDNRYAAICVEKTYCQSRN